MTKPAISVSGAPGGAVFRVRVSAGAARPGVRGEHGGALKVAVSAAPERGKANRALVELLAEALRVPRSSVEIVAGETSRDKRVRVAGLPAAALAARLAALERAT